MTNRLFAALLALLLVAPSGAFAFADLVQTPAEKAGVPQAIAPAAGLPALPTAMPSAAEAAIPAVAPVLAQTPAQSVAAVQQAVAPQLQAVAKPNASAEGSVQAGENASRILEGGKARDGGSAVDAGGAPSAPAAPLAAAQSSQPKAALAANAIPDVRGEGAHPRAVDALNRYAVRRAFLAFVSATFGVGYSLPSAGPRLSAYLLLKASSRQAVLSDIDDTLTKYNTVFGPETVAAVVAVRKAGKVFAAITDRPDSVKAGSNQLSALDSLSSIPAADRAGILVATNGGGKIYEYQADGTPKLVFEEPGLPESLLPAINEAAAVVKGKLAEAGTEMKSEFHSPYGYGLILKEGTPEATVKALAAELQAELRKRGVDFEVEGRMAKDPKLPPYLTFSKLNKSVAVHNIAALKKLKAGEVLIVGDSMYAPKENQDLSRIGRAVVALAERAAGPLPLTGNATDRNMERALPGALTLSVGGTADPSMTNGWVMGSKGPEMTRRILEAVAFRPAKDIVAEHESLVGRSRDFAALIRKAGLSADRTKSEYWELLMSLRDEVEDRIAALEKRHPALRGK